MKQSDEQLEDEADPNLESPVIENLYYREKVVIIILFISHRALQMLCAIQVMICYHLYVIIAICVGFAAGNLIFYGIAQDQIIINNVKRSILKRKVLN